MNETQAAPAARWEDFIDVFISPRELFERRANDRVWPPLLMLMGAGLLIYFIMLPVNRMVMEASMTTTPESAEAMQRFGLIFQIIGSLVVPIILIITVLFAAFLLWAIGKMFSVEVPFRQAMLIATFASFVYLLAQLIAGGIILATGADTVDPVRDLSFGPLRFMGSMETPGTLVAVLRRMDVFAIWQAVLWGIGLMAMLGVEKGKALTMAFLVWVLYTVPGVIMGALNIGGRAAAGG